MKALVSILIPAYNAESWITDTIKSALGQTWPRKEIIIVDDGSTDQTLPIARQFASPEVSVLTQKNAGAAAARNKAFSVSKGDYIQWLDADDLLSPDKISQQMAVLSQGVSKRTLLSSSWGRFMYRSHRAQFVPTSLWCNLTPVEWLSRKLEENVFMQTATWLVSRELTEAAGPWDTRLLGDDDGEYFCRVKLASDDIRFVPGAKVFYRVPGPGRLSHIGLSNRKLEAHFLSMQLHIRYLRSLAENERVRTACLKYLQTSLIFFHPERPDIVEQVQKLAADVGGELKTPRLSWKYAWIQKAFGWTAAKHVQLSYNGVKVSLQRSWDEALFHLKI